MTATIMMITIIVLHKSQIKLESVISVGLAMSRVI